MSPHPLGTLAEFMAWLRNHPDLTFDRNFARQLTCPVATFLKAEDGKRYRYASVGRFSTSVKGRDGTYVHYPQPNLPLPPWITKVVAVADATNSTEQGKDVLRRLEDAKIQDHCGHTGTEPPTHPFDP